MVNQMHENKVEEALKALQEFVDERAAHYTEMFHEGVLELPERDFSRALDNLQAALKEHGWVIRVEQDSAKSRRTFAKTANVDPFK